MPPPTTLQPPPNDNVPAISQMDAVPNGCISGTESTHRETAHDSPVLVDPMEFLSLSRLPPLPPSPPPQDPPSAPSTPSNLPTNPISPTQIDMPSPAATPELNDVATLSNVQVAILHAAFWEMDNENSTPWDPDVAIRERNEAVRLEVREELVQEWKVEVERRRRGGEGEFGRGGRGRGGEKLRRPTHS
ncbi:hypothetical protein P154DRAFT_570747 [Amniculicola lignicola CBS 123094]|uniref:Uncharacterized protein n=1 Tax=Amniculicola lignicola CBS 123094 TaxID=1392246 RepID=A0A6A5WWM8_9PLEO|nr:hypothetical protein P154DRAFT_570747 [Amniculicola lignicola CBS 123094]